MDKIKKNYQKNDRPIVIFPQGTRMDMLDRSNFKKGVTRIYDELQIKCQPVVMNSGSIWPKEGKIFRNKTLVISILKSIDPGLESELFLETLQKNIYNELEGLPN